MRILVVNTADVVSAKKTVKERVEEHPWRLSLHTYTNNRPDYLLAVENSCLDRVDGYFNVVRVYEDEKLAGKVRFELTECSKGQKTAIDKYIKDNNINLANYHSSMLYRNDKTHIDINVLISLLKKLNFRK